MDLGEELYGVVYERGEIVCRQGDKGDSFYIIQSGAVEVSRSDKDRDLVLALLEKGDFFGEMVLVDDYYRSATVKAIRKTRLLPLNREKFMVKLQEDPGVSIHLIRGIAQRIENTRKLLRDKIQADESLRYTLGRDDASSDHAGENVTGNDRSRNPVPKNSREEGMPSGPDGPDLSEFSVPAELCLSYEPGSTIYQRGEPGKNMFAVISGEVEIGDLSSDLPFIRLGPGDFFGHTEMLEERPYSSDALAVRQTRLLAINDDSFLDQIRSRPLLALYVLSMQVLRLRLLLAALTDPGETPEVAKKCLPPVIKKQERIRIAAASLSSCGGCGAALLDKPVELVKLLEHVHFVYCPLLMDQSGIPRSDIAVVDGVVRVREDEDKLREIRSRCRILVAWGSCAAIGGIPSMANRFEIEEIISESYAETLDSYAYYLSGSRGVSFPGRESGFHRRAFPVDNFVRVDYYLSGCPPNIELLRQLAMEITGQPQDRLPPKIVCAECPRKPASKESDRISIMPPPEDDRGVCFLSQGTVCMGSQTQGGCNADCPGSGVPCWGCRGSAGAVLSRLSKGDSAQDVFLSMVKARSGVSEESVKPILRSLRTRSSNVLSFQPYLGTDRSRMR